MTAEKQHFETYLKSLDLQEIPHIMGRIEHYHKLLSSSNHQVNLISRKMPPASYWTQHFLDSLIVLECLSLSGQTLLDFGSGGGLPGIPLKLTVPDCSLVLLDSIQKKTHILSEMCEALSLSDTSVVCSRLEDYAFVARRPSFDFILMRAVGMQERYLPPLRRLLKPSGKVIAYKSHNLDDLEGIRHEVILEKEDPFIGYRRIVSIAHRDLMRH